MRNIINISLPAEMVKMVKDEVKEKKYASVSEFFRFLLRDYEERMILRDIEISRKEINHGKGKTLKSFGEIE